MSCYLDTGAPGSEELLFLPLGGAGEIGMNLNYTVTTASGLWSISA